MIFGGIARTHKTNRIYSRNKCIMSGQVSNIAYRQNPLIGYVGLLLFVSVGVIATIILSCSVSYADVLPPNANAAIQAENKIHISQAESYIRKQTLSGMSILPSNIRDTLGWFSGGWHPLTDQGLDDANSALPGAPMTETSDTSGINIPIQLGAHYHHKGFLPTHDAMTMGIGLNQNLVDKKLQLTMRPFYGQNWHCLQHYWGGEMVFDVAQHPDGLPWGKISLGYVNGDNAMTDHGTGTDLHGDIDLTHNWTFTSGLRQDNISGDSNYMMVKWKLNLGGNP